MLYAVNNKTHSRGVPVVYYKGIPHTICAAGMTEADATVYCRQYGYSFGRVVPKDPGVQYNNPDMLLRYYANLNCTGMQMKLTACKGFTEFTELPCYDRTPPTVECSNTDNSESIHDVT